MTGKTVPRYLAATTVVAVMISGLILAAFYGQFVRLSDEIVETGSGRLSDAEFDIFEREATTQLERIALAIAGRARESGGSLDAGSLIDSAVDGNSDLTGLLYVTTGGLEFSAGDTTYLPGGDSSSAGQAPSRSVVFEHDVEGPDGNLGTLYGQFSLASVDAAVDRFRNELHATDEVRRSESLGRLVIVVSAAALLCGLVVWLVARSQMSRISDLRAEAQKLSRANFGEPLRADRDDELGDLARVFNEMRDKLRKTTVSRDFVDKLLSGMNESIFVTDEQGVITRVNDAAARMLDYTPDELVGKPIEEIIDSVRSGKLQTHNEGSVPDDAVFLTSQGDPVPVSYTGSIIDADNGVPGARIFAAQNITERRKAEKRIRYLARIDPLTKVPNRMQFQHLLQRAIAKAKRSNYSVALFYVDVDHFKEINDTFGHMAGDTALETVANRLAEVLPEDCIVGRLAGDEFAVIVDRLKPSEESMQQLGKLAKQVLNRLAEPLYVQGHEVFIAASMGIACYPSDGGNVIDLIRNADAALYHAKKSGGNTFTHFKPELTRSKVERLMTRSKLKRAFERDELLVRYQPRYEVGSGRVVGCEALVRWQLPDRGIILPNDFIPLAEENDLIIQIGEWVLDRVCEDFRYWQRSSSAAGRVSVNLSLRQLRQPNFINRIGGIVRSYEISPTCLELEITETTLMENPVRTIKILDELYALGLHLAIDDFGTGYSSLSALQQFPISTLKIDRSFVRDVATNADDATIVGTIIQMGNSLNMDVVAEGVETELQLNFLQNLGCAYVQGLLFGEPMSSEEYLDLVLAQADGTDKYRALFA